MHTAEILVSKPRSLEVEIATEKMKTSNLQSTDQIIVEFIQGGGKAIHFETHKLINSI
jgi:hypothetical protein